MKGRAVLLVLLWLLAMGYVLSFIGQVAQERRESHLGQLIAGQKLAWEAAQSRHVDSMQTLFETHVHTPTVLGYQQQALDPQQRDAMREALWGHLAPVYRQLSERGLRQFIFHLPGGEVLLRFHRPDHYGDNLVPVRPSIEKMNRAPQRITGFELGRNYLGFRHLFPLFTPEGDTMGSVELALPFEVVGQVFHQLLPEREYELILAAEVVDRRLEPSRRALYTDWPGSGEFYLERAPDVATLADPFMAPMAERLSRLLGRSEAARTLLARGEAGAVTLRYRGQHYAVTFTPAREIGGQVTGYLVSYQLSPELASILAYRYRAQALSVVALSLLLLLALLLDHTLQRRHAQQRRVQGVIEESNRRFELTMEATRTGLWYWDMQSNVVEWSELAYRQLGYAPGAFAMSLERFQQLMHPDDLEPAMASVMHSVEQGVGFDVQFRLRTAEGGWCWIQGRGRITERDTEGRPLYMMGTHTDISALKQAEWQMERQLGYQRIATEVATALAQAGDEAAFDDAIQHCLACLGQWLAVDRGYLFQFSDDYRLMSNTHEWCADGVEPQLDRVQQLPTDAMPWWKVQFMISRVLVIPSVSALPPEAEAERKEFEAQSIQSLITLAMYGEHGTLTGFLGFDSTQGERTWTEAEQAALEMVAGILGSAIERRRIEQRLDAERRQLLSILNSIEEGIYIADPQTHELLYMNDFMARTFPASSVGDKCHRVIQGLEAPCDFCSNEQLLANPGQAYRWEHYNPRLKRHFALLDQLIQWSDGREVRLELAVDITERKRMEQELARSNAELEQFAYAISHDMRQPLRMITGHLQVVERGVGDGLDAELRDSMRFAIEGARRMDQMIVALLEYSRVGRISDPMAWLASREAVDEALYFLGPALEESGAQVEVAGEWPQVYASRDELTRLLQNLIGNALKYHRDDTVPQITVTGSRVPDGWRVEVTDNGIGIPEGQSGRLFQVFSRLHKGGRFEGSGVGLALCRKIVEHHGGRIGVVSAGEGQGSTFWFELPQGETGT